MYKLILVVITLFLIVPSAFAAEYEPNQVIVKFKPTRGILSVLGQNPADQFVKKAKITSKEVLFEPETKSIQSFFKMSVEQPILLMKSNQYSTEELIKILDTTGQVEYAEPNYHITADMTPNDPGYFFQYAPSKLNLIKAWDIFSPSSKIIKIAVIDSGIDYQNNDVLDRIVDPSWFDASDRFNDYQDELGHGTHVAGIIAATVNNDFGIAGNAGLSPNVKIMPIRVLGKDGIGALSDAVKAMDYALNHNANIINLSLGTADAKSLHEMVQTAVRNNILIVASAGNNGESGNIPSYPAAYPEVIAVGATDGSDKPASYSTKGEYLDIAAPGSNILSIVPGDNMMFKSGTSMAAPQVSGIAGLLKSANPNLDSSAIRDIILQTARQIEASRGAVGTGIADAFAALHTAYNRLLDPTKVTLNGQHYTDEAYRSFGARLNPPVSTDQKTLSQDMVFQYPDSKGNLRNKTIRFEYRIPRYTLDYVEETSPYRLSAQCQSDGSLKVNWRKQADKRYKAVVFDCTNESNFGSCDPGNSVGATNFTAANIYPDGAFVAESLPDGSPIRLSDDSGNYPGNRAYGLFKTQKDRFYSVQLYDQNPDGSGFRAIDGVSTPEFGCSAAADTYSSVIQYSNPNPYGLQVSCVPDGSPQAGSLSWSFTNMNLPFSGSTHYRSVIYDCTDDPDPACATEGKNFIAATTPFLALSEVLDPQTYTTKGQTFITRPGHRYYVNIFSRPQKDRGEITVIENAVAQNISCR